MTLQRTYSFDFPDPLVQDFMNMYEDCLETVFEKSQNADELKSFEENEEMERDFRVSAMVDAAIDIRTEVDGVLRHQIRELEKLKEFKQYLLTEFKPFGYLPKTDCARVFAEYMIMTVLNPWEAEEIVNYESLSAALEEALEEMPDRKRENIYPYKDAFMWGSLV